MIQPLGMGIYSNIDISWDIIPEQIKILLDQNFDKRTNWVQHC